MVIFCIASASNCFRVKFNAIYFMDIVEGLVVKIVSVNVFEYSVILVGLVTIC